MEHRTDGSTAVPVNSFRRNRSSAAGLRVDCCATPRRSTPCAAFYSFLTSGIQMAERTTESAKKHAPRPRRSAVGEGGETHQTAAASGAVLTTNQGVPISDNQNSLKSGARGPSLLQDFILREKIMHFDHERIPERVVHA